jgi:hypothetical protein
VGTSDACECKFSSFVAEWTGAVTELGALLEVRSSGRVARGGGKEGKEVDLCALFGRAEDGNSLFPSTSAICTSPPSLPDTESGRLTGSE